MVIFKHILGFQDFIHLEGCLELMRGADDDFPGELIFRLRVIFKILFEKIKLSRAENDFLSLRQHQHLHRVVIHFVIALDVMHRLRYSSLNRSVPTSNN